MGGVHDPPSVRAPAILLKRNRSVAARENEHTQMCVLSLLLEAHRGQASHFACFLRYCRIGWVVLLGVHRFETRHPRCMLLLLLLTVRKTETNKNERKAACFLHVRWWAPTTNVLRVSIAFSSLDIWIEGWGRGLGEVRCCLPNGHLVSRRASDWDPEDDADSDDGAGGGWEIPSDCRINSVAADCR